MRRKNKTIKLDKNGNSWWLDNALNGQSLFKELWSRSYWEGMHGNYFWRSSLSTSLTMTMHFARKRTFSDIF